MAATLPCFPNYVSHPHLVTWDRSKASRDTSLLWLPLSEKAGDLAIALELEM